MSRPGQARGRGQEGGAARAAWTAGKTLGLKKTLPRQTEIQVHGKKKIGGWLKPKTQTNPALDLLPRCGDTCGCPALCCHAHTSPWHRALPWKEMPRTQTALRLVPGWMEGWAGPWGRSRGRGIFRLLPSGELLSLIPSDLFLRLTKSLPFPGRLWGLGSPQWLLSFRNFPWLSSPCCFLAVG